MISYNSREKAIMKPRISLITCLLLTGSWAAQVSATVPVLINDDFSSVPITNTLGGVAGDATLNDSLSGTSNPDASTTLTLVNDGGSGATLDANGNIHVAAGTTAGSYTLTYQSCDTAVPADCATATATIAVHEEPFAHQQCTVVDETVTVGVCGEWDQFPAAQNPWPVTPSGPGCSTWNSVSFTPDIVEPIIGLIGTNYLNVPASPAGGNYLGMAADAGHNEAVTVNLHSLIPGETYRISFTYINSGRRASERDPVFVRMTMPGTALPIGSPTLTYNTNPWTWHNFNATFTAGAATGSLILAADNTNPLDESGVGVDAIRVTRVRCVQPPTATSDNRTGAPQGTAVTIPVIDNDNDPENDIDPSTVNITTPGATDSDNDGDMDTLTVPGEGVWTVDNTTGAITFTPDAGFTGNPTPIQYNVRDATGLVSNTATVTITTVGPPTATNDTRTGVAQGTAVTIPVIDNDNDPENDIDPSTVNITTPGATDSDNDGDMDTLTVPGEGVWTVDNTTGAITFTPDAGFTGNPTPIQYNVRDATGLVSNTATVTITYAPATGVAANIPTLSGLSMLLLAMLLMVSVYLTMHRRKPS